MKVVKRYIGGKAREGASVESMNDHQPIVSMAASGGANLFDRNGGLLAVKDKGNSQPLSYN